MTYIVKQKIKGRVYAYEAKGYWDPDKKQSDRNGDILGCGRGRE